MRIVATTGLALALCSCSQGSRGVDPATWTCENLKPHIIEMSRTRRPRILEINQVLNETVSGGLIECTAQAEWAEGSGPIVYGGHVSDDGSVILEYRQE
jgi:hypothetical protein